MFPYSSWIPFLYFSFSGKGWQPSQMQIKYLLRIITGQMKSQKGNHTGQLSKLIFLPKNVSYNYISSDFSFPSYTINFSSIHCSSSKYVRKINVVWWAEKITWHIVVRNIFREQYWLGWQLWLQLHIKLFFLPIIQRYFF